MVHCPIVGPYHIDGRMLESQQHARRLMPVVSPSCSILHVRYINANDRYMDYIPRYLILSVALSFPKDPYVCHIWNPFAINKKPKCYSIYTIHGSILSLLTAIMGTTWYRFLDLQIPIVSHKHPPTTPKPRLIPKSSTGMFHG